MAHWAVLQEGDTELREPNLLSWAVAVLALHSRWNLGVCLPLGGCSQKDALEHGGLCNSLHTTSQHCKGPLENSCGGNWIRLREWHERAVSQLELVLPV